MEKLNEFDRAIKYYEISRLRELHKQGFKPSEKSLDLALDKLQNLRPYGILPSDYKQKIF